MKVLNILCSGRIGGIEILCDNIDKVKDAEFENYWFFLQEVGPKYNAIKKRSPDKVYSCNVSKYSIYKYIEKISQICEENNIDVIVFHHNVILGNIIQCILYKKYSGKIKFVKYAHSQFKVPIFDVKYKILNPIDVFWMKKALKISDMIICVSNFIKKDYIMNFPIIKDKIEVLYNGIDDKFFENYKEKYSKYSLVYVGRVAKEKGIDFLINAIELIKDEYKKVDLVIVGDGKEKNTLEKLVSAKKINNNIKFVGEKEDIISYLDNAKIFIYSSTCEEAFGISVVEAMARGCIPITFNKGGLPEIIEDNKTGHIVKEMTSEALAQKIKVAFEEEIGQNARIASMRFSMKRYITRLQMLYNKLLKNNSENVGDKR